MGEVKLVGLDGGNLLGFLAALGALRALSEHSETRMWWVEESFWLPVVSAEGVDDGEALLDVLEKRYCGEETTPDAWRIGKNLTLPRGDFRQIVEESAGHAARDGRATADWLAAFGSEAIGSGPKKELMTDTEFRTMSGAGHQHFLGFMCELARETTREDLERSLLASWDYTDDGPAMRWDPADFRPHALRAKDPAKDAIRTMRGANRLALEALPLFPTSPQSRALATAGFADRAKETEFSWPIWTGELTVDAVRSLLWLEELQNDDPRERRYELWGRGVMQVYRARRFTEGKYRNFSPARAVL